MTGTEYISSILPKGGIDKIEIMVCLLSYVVKDDMYETVNPERNKMSELCDNYSITPLKHAGILVGFVSSILVQHLK